ncbi:MAG: FmdE family protein [Sedimenticola sp.]|nr:FmdE family protein [Sedimenticola sp.]
MHYPQFYDQVEPIVLRDPLAAFLGAFEGGVMQLGYLDVVRLAGHSCPTVAGAYLMAKKGLKALYGDDLPVRGEIQVEMQESIDEGVCGVIANVLSFITGATDISGFHGLAGQFDRRHLLSFENDNPAPVRLVRRDTGQAVSIRYDASGVPADPAMGSLFSKTLSGGATAEEAEQFAQLWQARVKAILCDYADDPGLIRLL